MLDRQSGGSDLRNSSQYVSAMPGHHNPCARLLFIIRFADVGIGESGENCVNVIVPACKSRVFEEVSSKNP